MDKICLILLYFGKFPSYFHLFLKSAAYNSTIDFYIFTDMEVEKPGKYKNILFVPSTLKECQQRIEKAVGFRCYLDAPYKLCDYKPAYGIAFADYIKEYDWWGFLDADVILGNLRNFLTQDVLKQYEKISNLGHLMLFKNTKDINKRFLRWRTGAYNTFFEAAHSRRNVAFDEKGGLTGMSKGGLYNTYTDNKYIADIWPDTYHFRTFYNYHSDAPGVFSFEEGTLEGHFIESERIVSHEFMYIHLQARCMKVETASNSRFLILPNRFTDIVEIDEAFIENENVEQDKTSVVKMHTKQKIKGNSLFLKIIKKIRRIVFANDCFVPEKKVI